MSRRSTAFQTATADRSSNAVEGSSISRLVDLVTARPRRTTIGIALSSTLFVLLLLPTSLGGEGRFVLAVFAAAVVGWALTDLPDTLVALAAVALIGIGGALEPRHMFATLGQDLIWLMIVAFVLAAILRGSGLLEIAISHGMRGVGTIRGLFYRLAMLIAATAFLIPSTSARAALLVPVYVALADRIPDTGVRRGLALLFPTVILLSAGGSLIGAGAHIVAADFIARSTGTRPDVLSWALLALPFALATTVIATETILALFIDKDAQRGRAPVSASATSLSLAQRQLLVSVGALVGVWMTTPLHGVEMALAGLAAVTLILLCGLSPVDPKAAFKSVELELLVFLAATLVLVEALTRHGIDKWFAQCALALMPSGPYVPQIAVVSIVAAIALASHLVITSRTARASVLVPTLVLPLAALGHDPVALTMVTILGTGFCQTLPASAKPVALFASLQQQPFSTRDLMRLSRCLLPPMLIALVVYGLILSAVT